MTLKSVPSHPRDGESSLAGLLQQRDAVDSALLLSAAADESRAARKAGTALRRDFNQRFDHARQLRDAWLAVSGEFVPGGKAGLFPVPAQFEPHLPGKKLQLPSAGPVLNFKQHAEAYHRLMTDWECGQCARAAAGIPEVKRALSFVAAQVANASTPEFHHALTTFRTRHQGAQP